MLRALLALAASAILAGCACHCETRALRTLTPLRAASQPPAALSTAAAQLDALTRMQPLP